MVLSMIASFALSRAEAIVGWVPHVTQPEVAAAWEHHHPKGFC